MSNNNNKFSWFRLLLLGGFSLGPVAQPVQAETITIGKGTGVVWEGLPFNVTMSGNTNNSALNPSFGLLAISHRTANCLTNSDLITVEGVPGLSITPGITLVPRATGVADYQLYSGASEQLTGTLGLPKTEGIAGTTPVISFGTTSWCLPPRNQNVGSFYNPRFIRTVNISGTWVMMADGTQTNAEIAVPVMYAASLTTSVSGDLRTSILPANITLRISTLECTISTPTEINFGTVERNTRVNSELALLTNPLTVTCAQGMDDANTRINANINLQFHPISGLFEGDSHRLALTQGGGYITGEIANTVTGSGACNLNSGVSFDGTQIKVGEISEAESNKVLTHQVTWRLCSGGANLPVGPVTAAADMIVTFN